jgi:hypothetical protein
MTPEQHRREQLRKFRESVDAQLPDYGHPEPQVDEPYVPESLADRIAAGIERPTLIVPGLLYKGGRTHLWYGEPKVGKTHVVRHAAIELHRRHGARTLWLDHELGPDDTGLMLEAMGLAKEADDVFAYVWSPEVTGISDYLGRVRATVEATGAGHVVIDSLTRVLARLGLDESSNSDFGQFAGPFNEQVRELGIPHSIIDHTPKGGSTARGAGDKHAVADVAQHVTKVEPFSVTERGTIQVKARDDRSARLPATVQFDLGGQGEDGTFRLVERAREQHAKPEDKQSDKAIRHAALAQLLAENARPWSLAELAERFGKSDRTIKRDLRELAEQADLPGLS